VTSYEDIKHYRPGDTFVYELTFGGPLGEGVFPRAFLSGPDNLEEEHWVELATIATIVPKRDGETYYLEGLIPMNAAPGLYGLARVDILHSVTGMNEAKKIKSIPWDQLDQFAIIVEKPTPPKARDIPSVVRRDS
jgi:hypothetical protein